jgi:hypothetical protein
MKSGLMLGVNPNTKREENDFYATNPQALNLFLNKLKEDRIELSQTIWECACGEGHLSKALLEKGYYVRSSDKIDRGYGDVEDFLKVKDRWHSDILTNPPFKLAEQFVEKGMELLESNNKLILFLKIQFLESLSRYKLFKKYPLKYLYIHSSRQQCCKDANFEKYTATTQCYCWFIWEKGYSGDTIIRWIEGKKQLTTTSEGKK